MNIPKTPPKFVPTLTRVAQPLDLSLDTPAFGAAAGQQHPAPAKVPKALATAAPALDPHAITLRVLQRIDLILENRIREAVATVALEHARGIADEIRPAIEAAVHEAVNEALAREAGSKT
jgi:hypothetical protein